ncbi:MAG: hypothetical protein KGH58_03385 [Candidatus Micrarchaeota archaeon]|nr:hypothetical protein [Candidatus Micrarchaeota archaeon]
MDKTKRPGAPHGTGRAEGNDFASISPTAKVVAYFRAYTDIPYAKWIAQEANAAQVSMEMLGGWDKLDKMAGFLVPFLELRYKGINAQLGRLGSNSILEIASGISPRAIELSRNPYLNYVATDLPEMMGEQVSLFSRILSGSTRSNLFMLGANALNLQELEAAAAILRARAVPITVINEGLLVYLTKEEKARVASNIHSVLGGSGAWVTPDIYTSQELEAMIRRDPEMSDALDAVWGKVHRDMRDNMFDTREEAVSLFEGLGFRVERRKSMDGSFVMSSLLRLGPSEDRLEALGKHETWVMRPRQQ